MFNGLFYWLGSKGCAVFDAASEMMNSGPLCSHQQIWNMGAVLFGAFVFAIGYFVLRRRG